MASTVATRSHDVRVLPAARLRGDLSLPGDKSISHRALMLALLAEGTSTITNSGDGADVRSTAAIVARLGARLERVEAGAAGRDEAGNASWRVTSRGRDAIVAPAEALDCGNSGTSMRLFAGILAGVPAAAVLDGDGSLRRRPMARVVDPLRAMGAEVHGAAGGTLPPLAVRGRRRLRAIDWASQVPSAQVKSAVLLAGLAAEGVTRVRESVATRDHTERMLRARGVDVRTTTAGDGETLVELDGPSQPAPHDQTVPGDPSAAAFWLVAGAIHPDAAITLRGVGVNPTRRGVLDLLARMDAGIDERILLGDTGGGIGEPVADLEARSSELRAIDVSAAETAAAIDEIPVLCLAATQARGRTRIRGVADLRNKESDRVAGIVDGLLAFGARITSDGDDLVVDGPTPLHGATVDSRGDHRLALTFAVAGLVAAGAAVVHDSASAGVSYPTFFLDLERIRS